MTNFVKKFGVALGAGVLTVGALVQKAAAACTPGAGELCAADLQPILDAGLDRWKDTIVSFGTFLLPVIVVVAVFYVAYRIIRRAGHGL